MSTNSIQRLDLSSYAVTAPSKKYRVLFIHHSCGGQLLAGAGADSGTNCIYITHPNGGGLRSRLEKSMYEVHEASYGSKVGNETDIFDWLPKFRNQMEQILKCDNQDVMYQDDSRNEIVIFKSCFPNNRFVAVGSAPGISSGPKLTVWNAVAAYRELLNEFQKHPDVLFVCVTAPPLYGGSMPAPAWKRGLDRLFGQGGPTPENGGLARQFNNWLSATNGWLKAYPLKNVVVFDYYDILTGHGRSNLSLYASGDGFDSHPNHEGNEKAAEAFVPFLNQVVHRWQDDDLLTQSTATSQPERSK